jgi:hypothetical protein
VSGSGEYVSRPDYVQAGYYENATGYYPWFNAWLPFEANHDFRNCVFNTSYLDPDTGWLNTGFDYDDPPWEEPEFRVDRPSAYEFTGYWNYGSIPSVLSAAQTTWLHPGWDWSELGIGWDEDEFFSMQSNARTHYGLRMVSAKGVWAGGSAGLVIGLLQAGGSIADMDPGSPFVWFYPEVEPPQFQSDGYYFGVANTHLLPGYESFSTTNTTSLILAAVGTPIQIAGYAKLALVNGYAGKFAYLGQYFDKACKANPDGTRSTNETGFLSPYGQFFPIEPGPTILTTLPDGVSTNVGECTVHVISLNVDANHDGALDLAYTGPDQTSPEHPMVFWANNDYDRGHNVDCIPLMGCDWEEDDLLTAGCPFTPNTPTPDYAYRDAAGYRTIPCNRDLEDYARLWMPGLSSLMAAMPTNYTVELTLTGDGAIRIFQAVESDGGTNYLFNEVTASNQVSEAASRYVGLLYSASPILLSGQTNLTDHFIFCGAKWGTAEVHLQVLDGDQNLVADTAAYLDIRDVKEMYERWTVGDSGSDSPWIQARLAVEGLPPGSGGAFQYSYTTSDATTPYILHVHGWNMPTWEKDRFGESMFKRLYWQGYQGRFGIFRWPTLSNFPASSGEGLDFNHFDESEQQAWESGRGLRNLLVDLNSKYPGQVRLTAHSMGNVVAGEALRTNTPLVSVYVAMQAALPAGAYDLAAPFRAISFPYADNTPEIYRFYCTFSPTRPYFYQAGGASAYINFYNPLDWALDKWITDQNLKPVDTLGFSYDSSTNTFFQFRGQPSERILTCPTDTFELFAYCVEGQCWALGAQTNVGGVFQTSQQINLNTAYAFGAAHKGHSGQFRSTNMKRAPFWTALSDKLGVLP